VLYVFSDGVDHSRDGRLRSVAVSYHHHHRNSCEVSRLDNTTSLRYTVI